MKKSFYVIIAAFVTIVSTSCNESTQELGHWYCKYYEVDELTGWGGYYKNAFYTETGESFSCDGKEINLFTTSEIYNYSEICNYDYDPYNTYITVIVGFYKDKKLEEKVTKEFNIGRDGSRFVTLKDEELSKKILNHLKYVGDVRIVLKEAVESITLPMNKKIII